MSKRKKSNNSDPLPLFPDFDFSSTSKENQSKIDILKSDSEKKKTNINDLNNSIFSESQIISEEKLVPPKKIISNSKTNNRENLDLFLPFTYEDILDEIGEKKSMLRDLIVRVTNFEEQINQVLADMRNSGYLLFLYGVSGVGKSTFISSLKFQKYITIQEIVSINASELIKEDDSGLKLKELIKKIKQSAINFFSENNKNNNKLCIVIDYLENLEDEEENHVRAFFRDLNGLLRKYSILIIWPVTVREDLENMQSFAKDYSSTMFHTRIPYIEFTGPPLEEYPNIAKKTIEFFNSGKSCHEFQLTDDDFENLKNEYQKKPQEKHLIREYLKKVKALWEQITNYLQKRENSTKRTEVWFIFLYPEAEGVVARFSKQNPENINEMWNAEYNPLQPYINEHTQRKADWPPHRLTFALNTDMLTTKIMYLPTNALISCIVAYADDAKIPISREDFKDEDKYDVPQHWFGKQSANGTLKRTPLYLQLSGGQNPTGKRKSGTVEKALDSSRKAFKKINEDISASKSGKIGDKPFNKAICLALEHTLSEYNFQFRCEQYHPRLRIRPDITVETSNKIICLEFCYTLDDTPGNLANYVLRKLNTYMKQLEQFHGIPQDLPW